MNSVSSLISVVDNFYFWYFMSLNRCCSMPVLNVYENILHALAYTSLPQSMLKHPVIMASDYTYLQIYSSDTGKVRCYKRFSKK